MANPVQKVPSRQNLRNTLGLAREFGFLEFNTLDHTLWDDDFMGDTFFGGYQTTQNGSGAAAPAMTEAANGTIAMVTGSADGGRTDLSLGLSYSPSLNAVIAARIKVSSIATVKMEIGFTDVLSGTDAGAVDNADTTTFSATDCAVWCFDTDDTTDVWRTSSTYDAHSSSSVWTSTETGFAPVADTYETLIVALEGVNTAEGATATNPSTAHFYRLDANGYQTYKSAPITTGPTSNITLTPWLFVQNRTSSTRTMTVDFLKVWQRRTAS